MSTNFETYTYEFLLARSLARVPDTLDKREGSIIFDAIAPECMELSLAYLELKKIQDSTSADKAVGTALTDMAAQNGVFRKEAVAAQRKGTFNIAVEIGSRFSISDVHYFAVSNISGLDYNLECELAGEVGNLYSGDLIPIDYINNLNSAVLGDIILAGAEEESDEELRSRYKQNIVEPAQDGNVAQYKKWATDYEGVGNAKVFPLWNGGNTVKVAITNRLFLPAETALVNAFQLYMDPNAEGLGNGVAPIGSKVTISGGTRKNIDVSASLILTSGYTEAEGVSEAISDYLASITYIKNSVSYMRLDSAILDCASVADLSSLTINGAALDIALVGDEIPVLNSLSLAVV